MPTHKNIFKYLFISLFFFVSQNLHGQTDSLRQTGGLTIGIDLARFLVQIWEPVNTNFEFSITSDLVRSIYVNGEGGWLKTAFSDEDQNYTSGGYYLRMGGLYNLFKRKSQAKDMIYIGLLYGFSNFWHEADQITITDDYWGVGSGRLDRKTLKSNWLEIKIGIQIEIFKNWFLGWAIRPRFHLFGTTDERLPAYIIPGYGKGENNVNFGMSYYLAFRIPYGKNKR